jgi:hypothetical protein
MAREPHFFESESGLLSVIVKVKQREITRAHSSKVEASELASDDAVLFGDMIIAR